MNKQREYNPDFVSPPGETLLEALEERGMSQAAFASRTGHSAKTINEIIKGKSPIRNHTAIQFERVLNIPARFWMNRENNYQEHLARAEEHERLNRQAQWLKGFPYREMVKLGWIEDAKDVASKIQVLLNYFGLASPEQWPNYLELQGIRYRSSRARKIGPEAQAAWICEGEKCAQKVNCEPFDRELFRQALNEIRAATIKPVEQWQELLREKCAPCGVAVIFVRELPRIGTWGLTRWLTPEKALIQLSLRYKQDDHLWFTFFHEAAHILKHSKKGLYLEGQSTGGGGDEDKDEEEADRFAADTLIPPDDYNRFVGDKDFSGLSIKRFAQKIGVAPGIVVGRLQHDEHIRRSAHNSMKQRLCWKG